MKHFTYDEKSMTYTPAEGMVMNMSLRRYAAIITFALTVAFVIGYIFGYLHGYRFGVDPDQPSEKELKVLIQQADPFSEEKFLAYLKELNVKFPEIVFAQAVLETGHFQSDVFRANHNLFGMKEAGSRATTNHGTNLNHAIYHHWRESVIDYALYQASYLSDLRTPDEYYAYLSQHYAQDQTYVDKVKVIAQKARA